MTKQAPNDADLAALAAFVEETKRTWPTGYDNASPTTRGTFAILEAVARREITPEQAGAEIEALRAARPWHVKLASWVRRKLQP